MPVGLAPAVAQSMLNALCRGVAWTPPAGFFLKLHTGDPGPAGTANAFTDTTRAACTFAAAAADGTITTSTPANWVNLAGGGTLTHVSYWSASTAGAFLGDDDLATPRTVELGDTFTIPAGDVDVSLGPVAG